MANRNLWQSIFSEHIGFSTWTLRSVLVPLKGNDYGFTAAQKFFLVAIPTLMIVAAVDGVGGGNIASSDGRPRDLLRRSAPRCSRAPTSRWRSGCCTPPSSTT